MKQCNKCKQEKSYSDFNKNKYNSDGYQRACRICDNNFRRSWYKKSGNSKHVKEYTRNKRKEIRDWFNEYKKSLKCIKCGQDHPATLDFHHRDPNEKDFGVAELISTYSKETILNEIEKCDVLCANCHRIFHYEEKYGPLV